MSQNIDPEKIRKILEEEDYVEAPKYSFSLKKLMANNQDGMDDEDIARYLCITEKEVQDIYDSAIEEIRDRLGE